MITFSLVKSTLVEKLKRIVKVSQYGAKTALQAAPFGDDSHPVKDMVALYAKTGENGKRVILGYINKNQVTAEGEKRLYALKPDGSLSFYLHLKNNGTCELGGTTNNLVRYAKLDAALKAQDAKINEELAKIAGAITTLGGSYTPEAISTDISASKIDEVKTL